VALVLVRDELDRLARTRLHHDVQPVAQAAELDVGDNPADARAGQRHGENPQPRDVRELEPVGEHDARRLDARARDDNLSAADPEEDPDRERHREHQQTQQHPNEDE